MSGMQTSPPGVAGSKPVETGDRAIVSAARPPRVIIACLLGSACLIAAHRVVTAEDQVVYRAKEGRGSTRASGEIVDWKGPQLTLRHPGGREERIDTARIVEVYSTWVPAHVSADALFASRKYEPAAAAYRQALGDEPRGWVRRRLAAQRVWCLRYLNQTEPAIDLFLALYRQDAETHYFDAIPLSWLTERPDPAVARRSLALLDAPDVPAGVLMAASWLLPTEHRARAVSALRDLLAASDARIAFLAEAQLWRTQLATVKPEDLARWQNRRSSMPLEIQAGPTFLVAQALSRLDQPERATLDFLRLPILFSRHRELVGQSLLEAGRLAEKMKDVDAAQRLYREVIEHDPGSAAAGEARGAEQTIRKLAAP